MIGIVINETPENLQSGKIPKTSNLYLLINEYIAVSNVITRKCVNPINVIFGLTNKCLMNLALNC